MPRIIALTATVENMERVADQRGVVIFDRSTGDQWSATPGDYFYRPRNRPFLDGEGRVQILARQVSMIEPVLP